MTIRQFIEYADIYEYSKENYDLQKDIMELQLMKMHLESFNYINDKKFTINQMNHLMVESSNIDQYNQLEAMYTEKANGLGNKIKAIIMKIINALKSFFKGMKERFNKMKSKFQGLKVKDLDASHLTVDDLNKIKDVILTAFNKFKEIKSNYGNALMYPNIYADNIDTTIKWIAQIAKIAHNDNRVDFRLNNELIEFLKIMIAMAPYYAKDARDMPDNIIGPSIDKNYADIICNIWEILDFDNRDHTKNIIQKTVDAVEGGKIDKYLQMLKDASKVIKFKNSEIKGILYDGADSFTVNTEYIEKVSNSLQNIADELSRVLPYINSQQTISKINELMSGLMSASSIYMKAETSFQSLIDLSADLNNDLVNIYEQTEDIPVDDEIKFDDDDDIPEENNTKEEDK